jgi:hypothetical protein
MSFFFIHYFFFTFYIENIHQSIKYDS